MPYAKQSWSDLEGGGTPLNAASLTFIEDGIEAATDTAETAEAAAVNNAAAITTVDTKADNAVATANAASVTAATSVPKSTLSAKGSIVAATATSEPGDLAVGADGRVLEADAAEATGLKWGRLTTVSATAPPSPTTGDLWLRPTA